MRITPTIILINFLVFAGYPSAASQACKDLDGDSKKALQYRIDAEYGVNSAASDCGLDMVSANQVLLERGRKVLPCLLDIYRNGVKGELWRGTGPEPSSGNWVLPLIRAIDGGSAVPLYRELYVQASDDLTRVRFASELVSLGDTSHIAEAGKPVSGPSRAQVFGVIRSQVSSPAARNWAGV